MTLFGRDWPFAFVRNCARLRLFPGHGVSMRSAALAAFLVSTAAAAQVPESVFGAIRYRPTGPFRGGRALAATGVRGKPLTFYFGAVAGGVFRTDDGGAT